MPRIRRSLPTLRPFSVVADNPGDTLDFTQGGQRRLQVTDTEVRVESPTLRALGQAQVEGVTTLKGDTSVGGGLTVTGLTRLDGALHIQGRTPIFMRAYNMGQTVDYDTGVRTDLWNCFMGGFGFFDGDINENQAGDIIKAYTYTKGGTWRIRADFRAHNNEEERDVAMVCVHGAISYRENWWYE